MSVSAIVVTPHLEVVYTIYAPLSTLLTFPAAIGNCGQNEGAGDSEQVIGDRIGTGDGL
jgi:hypothetical protein